MSRALRTGAPAAVRLSRLLRRGARKGISTTRRDRLRAYILGSMSNVLNQREVTIEFEGRTVTGTYTVWSGMMTVSTALGKKATQVGGSESQPAPDWLDWLAKRILRELAQDENA
jgi:hypothetical protein